MNESVFNPAGPQADRIADMWWYMFWVAAAVWMLVVIALLFAAWRGHRRDVPDQSDEINHRLRRPVSFAAAVTVLILVGTLVFDVFTGEARSVLPHDIA